MTDSRRWFRYEADNGNAYAVELDESNSETTIGGAAAFSNLSGGEGLLPGRFKMRYLNAYDQANPLRRRRFFVGTAAAFGAISSQSTIVSGSITWVITSTRGERAAMPARSDTGLTDGDTPN